MQQINADTFIDTSLINCVEYQAFLDEMLQRGENHSPLHWDSHVFPSGHARYPLVGIRSSDVRTFCRWLTARSVSGWYYRLPTPSEAEQFPLTNTSSGMVLGYWVFDNHSASIAWIGPARPEKLPGIHPGFHGDYCTVNLSPCIDDFQLDAHDILPLLDDLKKISIEKENDENSFNTYGWYSDRTARDIYQRSNRSLEIVYETETMSQIFASLNKLSRQALSGFCIDQVFIIPHKKEGFNAFVSILYAMFLNFQKLFEHFRTRQEDLNLLLKEQINRASSLSYTDLSNLLIYQRQDREEAKLLSTSIPRVKRKLQNIAATIHILDNVYRNIIELTGPIWLLHERFEGRYPAFEGIRIVKERKPTYNN